MSLVLGEVFGEARIATLPDITIGEARHEVEKEVDTAADDDDDDDDAEEDGEEEEVDDDDEYTAFRIAAFSSHPSNMVRVRTRW